MPTRDDLKKLLYEQYTLKARVNALEDIVSLIQKKPVITFNSDDSNKEYKSSDRTIEGADS